MDLNTLHLQLQRSPGFSLTIQSMLSVPPLLPQNLKSFSFQASCPCRHKHFSKTFPISTHHLIWLVSPIPIHDTQPLFSAPLFPDNVQLYKQGTWAMTCLLRTDVSLGGTDRMTQNTASFTGEHLFLCVRAQLHSQIGGKCPNVSVLVEGHERVRRWEMHNMSMCVTLIV